MVKGRILFVLAVIGLLISLYLVAKTNDPSSVACSIGGGCETVLSSPYAKLFGLSVAIYGVAWYVVTVGLVFLTYFQKRLNRKYLRASLAAGVAFSLYLLGLEMFKIHAYCTWCLASLTVVLLMTGIELFTNQQKAEV